jgi:hypothetical protein
MRVAGSLKSLMCSSFESQDSRARTRRLVNIVNFRAS